MFHEEFYSIINVKQDQNNLILRLDASDKFEDFKESVLEFELINCRDFESQFNLLKKYVGEYIWNFEFLENEGEFKILTESDATEIIFHCESIEERKDDLTINELANKMKLLNENYERVSESVLRNSKRYSNLVQLLKREIGNDLRNWENRKVFYENNNVEKVDKAVTIIKFCNKILNLIHQTDKED